MLDDLAGTVDAIITDPPYPKEHPPLSEDLSMVAHRILRPGGICAVMVGGAWLLEARSLLGRELSYRWPMAYLTPGAAAAVYRRVQTYWKPILIFEKEPPDISHGIGGDVIRAEGGDTDPTFHHWGQNEQGMFTLINRLTAADDLIVDPFLGGGTTLVAAARVVAAGSVATSTQMLSLPRSCDWHERRSRQGPCRRTAVPRHVSVFVRGWSRPVRGQWRT